MSKLALLSTVFAPLCIGAILLAAEGTGDAPKDSAGGAAKAADPASAKPADATVAAAKKYPDQDPAKGSLEGRVTFEGEIPVIPPKVIPPDHKDRATCAAHVKEERLILSEKKEIKDVVVSVTGYKPSEKPKPREILVDNKDCTYSPHVQAATVGSTVKVTNNDGFIHNFHANLALQLNRAIGPGQSDTAKLPKEGWVAITCDFHGWMAAHIKVFAHDLFDLTGSDGTYKIANIPPGEYEIEYWHEYPVATAKQKVKIEAGKATKLDMALKSSVKK